MPFTAFSERTSEEQSINKSSVFDNFLYEVRILSNQSNISFEALDKLPEGSFKAFQNQELHKDSTYWLKVKVENPAKQSGEYYLHFNDLVSHIQLYQHNTDSSYNTAIGGILVPLAKRTLKGSIKDMVPFFLLNETKTTLYLKIRNQLGNANIISNLQIIHKANFKENNADIFFLQGGFLGILVLLFSFNLILFVFSKNRLYLLYSLYIISFVVFLSNIFQFTERFLLFNYPQIDIYMQWSYLIAQFIYLLFFIELLKIEKFEQWRKQLIRFSCLMLIFLISIFGISFFDYNQAMILCDCYSIINIIFIIVSFFALYRKARHTTKLILAGALFTVLGALITIVLSFTESFVSNLYYFQLGIFIELVLFTIAINYTYTQEILKSQLSIGQKDDENKALKEEIDIRNRDLTTKSLIIQEKETLFANLLQQFLTINNDDKNDININKLLSGLKHNISQINWTEVEVYFNKVHPQFYTMLQTKCPTITPNERKLCAFLKLNLSTKEIAIITGKSVNTIDVARSRLRKKMKLENSANLQTFISSIE